MSEIRPTLDLDLVWTAGHLPRKPIDADLFRLLEAIKRSGKLSVATAEVGLHYRQGWGLITAWSERMGQPLVDKARGRGTRLTALGERLLGFGKGSMPGWRRISKAPRPRSSSSWVKSSTRRTRRSAFMPATILCWPN